MSDNKVALVLFDIGFVLMLISMVTGPFGITDWSLTSGGAACLLALAATYLAFQNFDFKQAANAEHNSGSINTAGKNNSISDSATNR